MPALMPRRADIGHRTERRSFPSSSCFEYLAQRYGCPTAPSSVFVRSDRLVDVAEQAWAERPVPEGSSPDLDGEWGRLAELVRVLLRGRQRRLLTPTTYTPPDRGGPTLIDLILADEQMADVLVTARFRRSVNSSR